MALSTRRKGASMSENAPKDGTATILFQKQFGAAPGSQDPKAECAQWERLCDELLAERTRLRTELENMRLEQITKEWEQTPIPPWEEMQKQIDRSMTFEQLITDLKLELEAENEQP
jgi:hypothetical protein